MEEHTIETERMLIEKMVLGPVSTNCYVVVNKEDRRAFIVDPGSESLKIEKYIAGNGFKPEGIILTHGHFDHIMAVLDLVNFYKIKVYAGEDEEELLAKWDLNCATALNKKYGIKADVLLKDKEEFKLAGFTIKTIKTPGHTSGGVCYYIEDEKMLFSGDTLFHENIGRTDLPTGNEKKLIASINERLMTLPEDVVVYTGHDEKTSIGYEKENNVFIKDGLE